MRIRFACLSNKFQKSIIDEYQNTDTSCSILAKKYKVSKATITEFLHSKNIKLNFIRYSFNEKYFDNIDSEDKSYFLGLLYADGCNLENDDTVILQMIDKDIIEKFKNIIKLTKPIYFRKKRTKNHQDSYRIEFINKYFSTRLKNLGCMANKTFKLQFPNSKILSDNLIRHFIRGYFDGDGSFMFFKDNRNRLMFTICIVSTDKFCINLKNILKNKLNINCYLRKRHKNRNNCTRQLEFAGRLQVFTFLNWIYYDSTVKLDRKFNKYMRIKKHLKNINYGINYNNLIGHNYENI